MTTPASRSFTGAEARLLLRRARTAALGTRNREPEGPYVSLVNIATDGQGYPVIFISRLAWHTRNIEAAPVGSVLVSEIPAEGDALTGPRVTVMGQFERLESCGYGVALCPSSSGSPDLPRFSRFLFLAPET